MRSRRDLSRIGKCKKNWKMLISSWDIKEMIGIDWERRGPVWDTVDTEEAIVREGHYHRALCPILEELAVHGHSLALGPSISPSSVKPTLSKEPRVEN